MLAQRLATALVLLPLLLAAIFLLSTPHFYAVLMIVAIAAATEWSALMGRPETASRLLYAMLVAAVSVGCWYLGELRFGVAALALASLVWWLAAVPLVKRFPASFADGPWSAARMAPLGVLVLPAAIRTLAALHAQPNGSWRVMFMLFVVFAADVGAYLVGRNFGKRKLAPAVSPGKSVEGAVGGLLLAALWAACAGPLAFELSRPGQILTLVLISMVASVFSIVGDLTESLFKRLRGLKDSGKLLPGHGGVLDRIDAILAAAPVFYLGVALLRP